MKNLYPEQDPPESRTQPPIGEPAHVPVRINLATTRPVITYVIMGVTIFVYLLQLAGQYLLDFDFALYLGAKINEAIAAGQVWRLVTPMLLHGSWLHIGFNMYALFIFGTRLERFYGHWRFLTMYLLGAFTGNVLSYTFSSAVSVGASTAIFGLLGAEGVFLYRNWKVFGPAARRDLNNLILLAVVNLIIGLTARFDNWGHLGGLLGGVAFAWLAGPVLVVVSDETGYSLKDSHGNVDAIRAAILVGAVFVVIALIATWLRI